MVTQPEASQPSEVPLTPESAQAIADHVIESAGVIPKKIPPLDDIEGQTQAIGGALASALLTATEMPLHTLQPVVGALASQLVALGVRQTENIDPEAIYAPAWITDGVRQESIKLSPEPQHTDGDPFTARTAEAPEIPETIPRSALAVPADELVLDAPVDEAGEP